MTRWNMEFLRIGATRDCEKVKGYLYSFPQHFFPLTFLKEMALGEITFLPLAQKFPGDNKYFNSILYTFLICIDSCSSDVGQTTIIYIMKASVYPPGF